MKPRTGDAASVRHPAKYSAGLTDLFAVTLDGFGRVLDPFAGVGGIHDLQSHDFDTVGVEIEPEWANQHPDTRVGNALSLPFDDNSFDAVCTSPTYGNRMADHHEAADASRRHTYRHTLGRTLHSDNSGQMQWGEAYRDFHQQAWLEVRRVLRPGGRFVLNVKDHIRGGKLQPVTGWHAMCCVALGFELRNIVAHAAPAMRHGANADARAGNAEPVLVFDLPSQETTS